MEDSVPLRNGRRNRPDYGQRRIGLATIGKRGGKQPAFTQEDVQRCLALFTLRLVETSVREREPWAAEPSRPSAMHPVRPCRGLWGRRQWRGVTVRWW